MENLNLPPFHIGQKVVAVENVGPIVKGNIYTVMEQFYCSDCKLWHTTVKEFSNKDGYDFHCSFCSNTLMSNNKFLGARHTRFAPIQEQEFKQVTYTKVLEEVPCCEN